MNLNLLEKILGEFNIFFLFSKQKNIRKWIKGKVNIKGKKDREEKIKKIEIWLKKKKKR